MTPTTMQSAVAGMDLALATGRGDPLMTEWPGVPAPLVPDEQVVQIGEREGRSPGFIWADVNDTAFNRIDVFDARERGAEAVVASALATVGQKDWPFFLHFDVDVLDQAIMPAVDSPGSPGIDPDELRIILARLIADRRCAGMTVTIFDPDLDPDGSLAAWLVAFLRRGLRRGKNLDGDGAARRRHTLLRSVEGENHDLGRTYDRLQRGRGRRPGVLPRRARSSRRSTPAKAG